MIIQSNVLNEITGITHGFGTYDEPIPEFIQEKWPHLKPTWKQVHGCQVTEVTHPLQDCGEVDGLYTSAKMPIAVITADCVPVLLSRRDGGTVAAIHAGWRGTRARILRSLWTKLEARGEQAEDWIAAIGPAIGPCCYEVSSELAEDFSQFFYPEFKNKGVVPRDRILDLPLINRLELEKLGFQKVDLIRYCTNCSTQPKFHSHRRDHASTRQWSVITKNIF